MAATTRTAALTVLAPKGTAVMAKEVERVADLVNHLY